MLSPSLTPAVMTSMPHFICDKYDKYDNYDNYDKYDKYASLYMWQVWQVCPTQNWIAHLRIAPSVGNPEVGNTDILNTASFTTS